MGLRTRIAAVTIVVGVAVLSIKALAWSITGSAALYADALESTVNVAAALIAFGALRLAARPADANHPYGHDKAEFFAAVLEGVLIVGAAALILADAWTTWQRPHPIATPWRGVALNLCATVVNAGWAAVLVVWGRRLRSPALAADGRHLIADVVTSIGVVIGVTLAVTTGIERLDPAVAAITALQVLAQGAMVMRSSIGGLMDEAPASETMEHVRSVVGGAAEGALEAHDLRMRQAGRLTFLEFHLVVPGRMSVDEAHDICDRVEVALRHEMEDLVVTIHVEPERKAKHSGVVVL